MTLNKSINRAEFFKSSLALAGVSLLPSVNTFAQEKPKQEKPAPINLEIVKEFVGASHGKFDRVKEMLEENHLLLHVSYDWGGAQYYSGKAWIDFLKSENRRRRDADEENNRAE